MKANIILSFMIIILIIVVIAVFKNNAKVLAPLQVPFFASINSNKVNVRTGPGLDYPIIWTYEKRNVPIKVLDVYGTWYKIQDLDGGLGWVYKNLTKKNSYIISINDNVAIYKRADKNSKKVGSLGKNAVIRYKDCKKQQDFCYIKLKSVKGYIAKENIWGYDKKLQEQVQENKNNNADQE